MGLNQQGREGLAPPGIAAYRQRPQRIAVIALPAGDEMPPLRLAFLHKELAREFKRGLDRLRAAAHQIDMGDAGRRLRDQHVGQRLGGLRGEEAGVGIGERVELRMHRGEHVGMPVAEAGDRRAARRIEIVLAAAVADEKPLRAGSDRIVLAHLPVQDVAHCGPFCLRPGRT